ncbi:energy transducer TonB [Spongorhabdus nitratireducens]
MKQAVILLAISGLLAGCVNTGSGLKPGYCYKQSYKTYNTEEAITWTSASDTTVEVFPKRITFPVYPAQAIIKGIEGKSKVQYEITTTGRTDNIKVLSSSSPAFGKSLARSVSCWEFQPVAKPVTMQQDYEWVLE